MKDIINERPSKRKLLKVFFTMNKEKIDYTQYVSVVDSKLPSTSPLSIPHQIINGERLSLLKPSVFYNISTVHYEKILYIPDFSSDFDKDEIYLDFLCLQLEDSSNECTFIRNCYLFKENEKTHNCDPFEVIKSILRRCEIPYLDLDTGEEYREYMWINRPEPEDLSIKPENAHLLKRKF